MQFIGTENFKVSELEYSDTAKALKIDNTIPDDLEENTKRLLKFLQGIREAWGSGIRINSGYRGPKLNKAVKGSATSAHLTCNAADLYPSNGRFDEFKEFMIKYLSDKNFDQCIVEQALTKSGKVKSQWIHFGLYNNSGKQRRQIFKMDV